MTMAGSPRLWLKCGTCNGANLATLSTEGSRLPGEDFAVQPRRDGRWNAYPRKGHQAEWTHQIDCRRCKASHKVSGPRLASWWAELVTSGQRRDTRYLGRDY